MRPFAFQRVKSRDEALSAGAEALTTATSPIQYLAGGTTLIDLMRIEVIRPERVIDISALPGLDEIRLEGDTLKLGALARMSDTAANPEVSRALPLIKDTMVLAASAQLRNMASLGGNVLQRTRCMYFRDTSWSCNKRDPGSGCSAIGGVSRNLAVLGQSEKCIANYPGDFAIALAALDATVRLDGPSGRRALPFDKLHRLPGDTPHVETTLRPGELIVGFEVPAAPWMRRSLYLKVRDRKSYEFALASAAIALDLDNGVVRDARIGLGGLVAKPWRSLAAEDVLRGKPFDEAIARAAAEAALADARGDGDRAFKPELGRRTLVRALLECSAMEI